MNVAKDLVHNTVHVNPAKLLSMNPVERSVYDFIDGNGDNLASFAEVIEYCEGHGFMIDQRSVRTILNNMVVIRILNKYNGDIFTTRSKVSNTVSVGAMAGALGN